MLIRALIAGCGILDQAEITKKERLQWASWLIVRLMDHKQKVGYAIFAAELVINYYESEYPNDDRPRKAIESAIAYIAGKKPAHTAAYAAANAARAADYAADYAAYSAAHAAAYSAYSAANSANSAYSADYAAAYSAYSAYSADYAAAYSAYSADYAANAAAYAETLLKILEHGLTLLGGDKNEATTD
jgi:hypothetical protein